MIHTYLHTYFEGGGLLAEKAVLVMGKRNQDSQHVRLPLPKSVIRSVQTPPSDCANWEWGPKNKSLLSI
jgi:hypothetical protein